MRHLLIICFMFLSLTLTAQNKINPVIQVERLYDADLMEVTKPVLDTRVPDSLRTFNTLFQYTIFDKPLSNLYAFVPLAAAVMEPQKPYEKHFGYLSLGSGYPWTPAGDLHLQLPVKSRWFMGIDAIHRSLWDETERMTNQGSFILERRGKHSFYIKADGEHLYNTFVRPLPLTIAAPSSQIYYRAGGQAGIYSLNDQASTWSYRADLSYRHASASMAQFVDSLASQRENALDGEFLLGYNLSRVFSVNLGAQSFFSSRKLTDDSVWVSKAIVNIFPHVIWSGEKYKLSIGARVGFLLTEKESLFDIFPWIEAHYAFDPAFAAYFSMDGKRELNTLQNRIPENPWLLDPLMNDRRIRLNAEAGFTGTIQDVFSYRIYGGYRITENQIYYRTIPYPRGYPGCYKLDYDDETRYTAGAWVSYHSKPFEAKIHAAWYKYILSQGTVPWHMPAWEISGQARYNWRERIIVAITAGYRSRSGAPGLYDGDPVIELPAFTNIGARVEYVWGRHFSTFLYGHNLLDREIYYYNLYREPGITFGTGLTLRF